MSDKRKRMVRRPQAPPEMDESAIIARLDALTHNFDALQVAYEDLQEENEMLTQGLAKVLHAQAIFEWYTRTYLRVTERDDSTRTRLETLREMLRCTAEQGVHNEYANFLSRCANLGRNDITYTYTAPAGDSEELISRLHAIMYEASRADDDAEAVRDVLDEDI